MEKFSCSIANYLERLIEIKKSHSNAGQDLLESMHNTYLNFVDNLPKKVSLTDPNHEKAIDYVNSAVHSFWQDDNVKTGLIYSKPLGKLLL